MTKHSEVERLEPPAVMLMATILDRDWAYVAWHDVGRWWCDLYEAQGQSKAIMCVFKSMGLPEFSRRDHR